MNPQAQQVIAVHGAPRSGTSWLGQLFNSHPQVAYRYQPFFSYAFRGRVTTATPADALRSFLDDLLATNDDFVLQTGRARVARAAPTFEKSKSRPTHLVYKEVRFHDLIPILLERLPTLRVIGLVRDPRSVLASWFNAPREFRAEWSPAAEWRDAPLKNAGLRENWYGYTRWKELARMFSALEIDHPDSFRIVRYESLVADPISTTFELFAFCGLTPGLQTTSFIRESTSRDDGDPYGVFRSRRGIHAPALSDDIARIILDDLQGTSLARFLAVDPLTSEPAP